ncbi:hypothetical protein [Xiamenia xianingshaonis]|uniref:hypothetical protein n=1 Tax=Xiamenia xianingshaonis TaxID=2682776 RepID=UPI0014083A40
MNAKPIPLPPPVMMPILSYRQGSFLKEHQTKGDIFLKAPYRRPSPPSSYGQLLYAHFLCHLNHINSRLARPWNNAQIWEPQLCDLARRLGKRRNPSILACQQALRRRKPRPIACLRCVMQFQDGFMHS